MDQYAILHFTNSISIAFTLTRMESLWYYFNPNITLMKNIKCFRIAWQVNYLTIKNKLFRSNIERKKEKNLTPIEIKNKRCWTKFSQVSAASWNARKTLCTSFCIVVSRAEFLLYLILIDLNLVRFAAPDAPSFPRLRSAKVWRRSKTFRFEARWSGQRANVVAGSTYFVSLQEKHRV